MILIKLQDGLGKKNQLNQCHKVVTMTKHEYQNLAEKNELLKQIQQLIKQQQQIKQ